MLVAIVKAKNVKASTSKANAQGHKNFSSRQKTAKNLVGEQQITNIKNTFEKRACASMTEA